MSIAGEVVMIIIDLLLGIYRIFVPLIEQSDWSIQIYSHAINSIIPSSSFLTNT